MYFRRVFILGCFLTTFIYIYNDWLGVHLVGGGLVKISDVFPVH